MIVVFAEHFAGKLLQPTREAIALARSMDEDVTVLVAGENVDDIVNAAFHAGATHALKADDNSLAHFRVEPFADLLTAQIKTHNPSIVIAGATTRGRELLAAVSADLDAPLLDDVTELEMVDGKLVATHPVYAGKVLSKVVVTADGVQLVTLRNRAFPAGEIDESRTGEIIEISPETSEFKSSIEGFEERSGEVNLTEAAIVVSGGRGVGGPEGFEPIKALADALGGAMGASRATVDAGWIPYAHQVGQTGKVVSPDLYIAAGISGAIQHQAGMRTSKTIVAINKNADAPIFKLAHYGVVGDLFEIVPALTEVFKERLSN